MLYFISTTNVLPPNTINNDEVSKNITRSPPSSIAMTINANAPSNPISVAKSKACSSFC
ncbi:hypothetical protein PMSV_188 [Photobacterium leiognathi subsp. mandapamensis svers.1.1.]|nr:hypothetical protein PMSV_188 [Photobacterium leiognathi subsp. mandapamensis svers.1.1.]